MSNARVFLYVQHLLGIGHLKRALTLARAFSASGMDVTVASGGFDVPALVTADVRVVQLPPLGSADLSFKNLIDASGKPIDDQWKRKRCDVLLATFRSIAPNALVTELFPFGRRQMRFELLPLLEAALGAAPRPLIVSSARDICGGRREPSRQQESAELVARYFDRVLVHGDPRFIALEHSFPLAHRIADRIAYTGYVVERARDIPHNSSAGRDEVIVSAGGGAVGRGLIETALRARALTRLAGRTWRILTGINASAEDAAMIEAVANEPGKGDVIIERMRDDFTVLLKNCAVSVSQGGYNTVMEILDARARAVVVPFAGGAETEQSLRATALAARGLFQLVDERALSPEALAAAIDRAAAGPRPAEAAIDMRGAERSATLLGQWLAERT